MKNANTEPSAVVILAGEGDIFAPSGNVSEDGKTLVVSEIQSSVTLQNLKNVWYQIF